MEWSLFSCFWGGSVAPIPGGSEPEPQSRLSPITTRRDPPDRVSPPLDEQVKMVRHQAVGVEEERQLLLGRGQQREELPVVLVGVEDRLPVLSRGR